jgi:hypothetical protein
MPSPDLATDDQRWAIYDLFAHFGIKDMHQVRADAARILRLESGLTDLRNLTRADADELIGRVAPRDSERESQR